MKTREEIREYERNWYSTTGKEKRLAANKRWRERKNQEFKSFKRTLKCSRCPEDHIACLDFHHLDPTTKEKSVSKVAKDWSLERLKKEVAKCIVLCANCHRKEHYNN